MRNNVINSLQLEPCKGFTNKGVGLQLTCSLVAEQGSPLIFSDDRRCVLGIRM